MRRLSVLLLLLVPVALYGGKPKPHPTLVKLPAAVAEIKGLELPNLKQHCTNWAWAAAIELMLARQDVHLTQDYWVLKANGGEVCVQSLPALDDLKRLVDGNYVLLDGRNIHLEGVVTPGPPQDVGYLIRLMREGRPLLVVYREQVMVLQSVEFDEYIYPNDQRMYEVEKLVMLDPLGDKPVTFDKAKDNPAEIMGVFEVRSGPIEHFK